MRCLAQFIGRLASHRDMFLKHEFLETTVLENQSILNIADGLEA